MPFWFSGEDVYISFYSLCDAFKFKIEKDYEKSWITTPHYFKQSCRWIIANWSDLFFFSGIDEKIVRRQRNAQRHAYFVFCLFYYTMEFPSRWPVNCYRKASFRGAPSAHPDWIVPSVDEEVEMKFQRTIWIFIKLPKDRRWCWWICMREFFFFTSIGNMLLKSKGH